MLAQAKNKRLRADQLLAHKKLVDSREQAKKLILAGVVYTPNSRIEKASQMIDIDTPINIKEQPKYVSRAGYKIETALDHFNYDPSNLTCLDIGASTGGFTDCLLQRGAKHVYTIDVGTNQLVWKIRSHPQVTAKEQFNARNLSVEDLGEPVDLIVMDLSFISLTKILPNAFSVLKPTGSIMCLIKPQFELQPDKISKGGIVLKESLRQEAQDKIKNFTTEKLNKKWQGIIPSKIQGTQGNQEYIAWLTH